MLFGLLKVIKVTVCFQKRLYLSHSSYALIREHKNKEKVKQEIKQWMYCINVKEQYDVRLLIEARIFSRKRTICSKQAVFCGHILSFTSALIFRDIFFTLQ